MSEGPGIAQSGVPDPMLEIARLRLLLLNRGSALLAALAVAAVALWVLVPTEAPGGPSGRTLAITVMVCATALWRSGPYAARALLLVVAFLLGELECLLRLGYVPETAVMGFASFVITGLLLSARFAAAAWVLSTAIIVAGVFLVGAGVITPLFDPVTVDPRDLRTGVRFALIYGGVSGILAIGVWVMVSRFAKSLDETHGALEKVLALQAERRLADEAHQSDEQQWLKLVGNVADLIFNVDREHRIEFINRAPPGMRIEDVVGQRAESFVPEQYGSRVRESIDYVLETGRNTEFDAPSQIRGRAGAWFTTRVTPILRGDEVRGVTMIATDITERQGLEAQLRQSQKLEAIGQLTGGVAHDFNNLLTIILGNLELAADEISPEGSLRELLTGASAAAERGAALTHRLLAFSRKQALRPRAVDLGALLAEMRDLLARTLGETIRVELETGEDELWICEADPAELESAILNLAINARDAMPGGGTLTIETANATLDETYAAGHDEVAPDDYVMIAVSDTGTGMSPEVLQLAFDPFFTTKEVGHGSGLGLSTVYGFVRQSRGHVSIDSEVGTGTTVRMYLPRSLGEAPETLRRTPGGGEPRGNGELILVVEDDEHVRPLSVRLLRNLGYRTIEAVDVPSALVALDDFPEVALLFTDLVLPGGASGADLARVVRGRRPELALLFTSGYTQDAIGRKGRLDPGVTLLEKPFGRASLARVVRAALVAQKANA